MQELTEEQWQEIEERDINEYYDKAVREYIELSNNCLDRSKIMGHNDMIRTALHPDLSDDRRAHMFGRTWCHLQLDMIGNKVINLNVLNMSLTGGALPIPTIHHAFSSLFFGEDINKVHEEVKAYPDLFEIFKGWAIEREDCPKEILVEEYTSLK